jgi:protocatechuate 4,5-dioxygenase beta chain
VVPIFVNVIQYPIPLPSRCWAFGKVLRQAIESYDSDERFVVLGTGGLSHQLQGARAGFVNPPADAQFLRDIAENPHKLAAMSREQYVEIFGSEGAELIMWLVMRGALNEAVETMHQHYVVPTSMTGAGMIVLENR